MPRLYVEKGVDRGLDLVIRAGQQVVAGRDEAAQFRINDQLASRRHFAIGELKGSWLIKDLGSGNGTLLNGKLLEPEKATKIDVGMTIGVGDSLIAFLPSSVDGSDDPLIGNRLGGYRIDQRIGRGAMGVVYRAHQLSLGRDVALKVLSDDVAHDQKFATMFVQEARAAATLNHQNILQVYDVSQDDGKLFIAMEMASSGSVLDELRRAGTIPLDRSIQIITDALKALEYAERKGLVHRDIKPDNLMITGDGAVKLGDLGLAAQATDLGSVQAGVFGTPHYIAPEQAQGKAVDHRADLYALGASWYRMLTGNTLFQGATVRDILRAQVRERHISLREVIPNIPPAISSIVDRLLEKEPDQRYQSATQVLEDLSSYLANRHAVPSMAGGVRQPGSGNSPVMVGKKGAPIGVLVGIGVAVIIVVVVLVVVLGGGGNGDPIVNPGPTTGNQLPPGPTTNIRPDPQPRPSVDAIRRFAAAEALEGVGDVAGAITIYQEIVQYYPSTEEAKRSADRLAELESAAAERNAILDGIRSQWQKLVTQADEEWLPVFALRKTEEAVVAFTNGLPDAESNPPLKELLAEINPEAWLVATREKVTVAFDTKLVEAGSKLSGLALSPIEERPEIVTQAVAAAEALQKLTDDTKLKDRAGAKIAEWKALLERQQTELATHLRRIREAAAATSLASFWECAKQVGAASSRFDYARATQLLEEWVAQDQGLATYGEHGEYKALKQLVSDRRHQTTIQRDAIVWLSRTWHTDRLRELADEPLLRELFPAATELQLIPRLGGETEIPGFRYNIKDHSREMRINLELVWTTVDPRLAVALISWQLKVDDPNNPNAVSSLMTQREFFVHRLGLGAQLLESGDPRQAQIQIDAAYRGISGGDDPVLTRRAREYMAYALAAGAAVEAASGNLAQAESLLARLRSSEFEGCRAVAVDSQGQ